MKKITLEEKARRDARRAEFQKLWKLVAAMPETDRIALAHKHGLRTVTGHELSLVNQILVITQNSKATIVGGFRQWIQNGRAVRKGEHGATIWVPIGAPKENADADSNIETYVQFIIGTVFDISQTEELQSN